MGPAFTLPGGVSLKMRRVLFSLSCLALLGTAGTAIVNRAQTGTYSQEIGRAVRSLKPPQMDNTQTFAGIIAGRVYSGKTGGFVQTPQGVNVFGDRRVLSMSPTGGSSLDYSVEYVTPDNPTPATVAALDFLSWVEKDVTDQLPPANGAGQTGNGHDWRAYAGGAAEATGVQPSDGPALATTPTSQPFADSSIQGRVSHTEGGEGGPADSVTERPASAPNADRLANAKDTASEAQEARKTPRQSHDSRVADQAAKPKQTPRESNDSRAKEAGDASATASSETLRDKARKH